MTRFIPMFLVVMGLLVGAAQALAALRVEPAIIDLQVFPRETPHFTVNVINDSGSAQSVYPMVGEFDAQSGTVEISGTPYDANRLISANLEIPRDSFTVAPFSSRSLTGKVNVSPHIGTGTYHAVVAFTGEFSGEPGRDIALAPSLPRALLNVTVRKDIKERLNLTAFNPLRKFNLTFPSHLKVRLENGGNVAVMPVIETRFFGRRDDERGSVKTEVPEGGAVAAGATSEIPVVWDGDGGFGRYRAHISVSYGIMNGGQFATASAVFWVLPLWLLVLLAVALVVLSYGAARAITRGGRRRDEA